MNKVTVLFVSVGLALGGASLALAQGMGAGQAGMGMMKMDANGDGVVSKEEYMKYHEGMFDHMKKNKEGMVVMKDMPAGCDMGSMMGGGKGAGSGGMMGGPGMMGGGQGMMGGQGGGAKKTP